MPVIPTGQGAQIVINGNLVDMDGGTIDLVQAVGQCDTLNLTINDPTNTYHFQQGNSVTLYDATATAIFGGVVQTSQETKVPYTSPAIIKHTLTCQDNHYHATKLIAIKSYNNVTAAFIVNDLITSFLAVEGVTAGTISTGVTLNMVVYNVVSVSDILDDLAQRCGFYWSIDANKVLTFASYGTTSAPFTFDGSQAITGTATVTNGNQEYRNTQYVLGGNQPTGSLTETHKGDGNTRTWALGYIPTATPMVTKNGSSQTVGTVGNTGGYQWYWDTNNPVITQDPGQTVLSTSDTLAITYAGQFPVVTIYQNTAQVLAQQTTEGGVGASSGIVASVTQPQDNSSPSNSGDVVLASLNKYAKLCQTVEFITKQSGLKVGQLLTVNLPEHAISGGQALIQQIEVSEPDGLDLYYDVTAIVGPINTNWVQFFQALIPTTVNNDVTLGTQVVAQYFAPFTLGLSLGMSYTESTFACPIPNTTLNPSTTLYPC